MTTTTTRRNVVKGTAWAIPAVTIAASAPATAASAPCDPATNVKNVTITYRDGTDQVGTEDHDFTHGLVTGEDVYTISIISGTLPAGTKVGVAYRLGIPEDATAKVYSAGSVASDIVHTGDTAGEDGMTFANYTQTATLDKPLGPGDSFSMNMGYQFSGVEEGYTSVNASQYPYDNQTIVGDCETTIVTFSNANNTGTIGGGVGG